MAGIEWEFHKKQYAEDYAPKGVTKAEYARLFNLPANSARRVFSAIKVEKPATKKPPQKEDVNAGVRQAVKKKAREIAAKNRKQQVERASDRLMQGDHPEKSDHFADKQKRSHAEVITNKSDHRETKRKDKSTTYKDKQQGVEHASDTEIENDHFLAGRESDHPHKLDRLAGFTFGAFAEFLALDPEVQAAAELIGSNCVEAVTQLQTGRYLQMTKIQNQMLRDIEETYAEGKSWTDAMGNPIPKARAVAECVFSYSEQMTAIETAISRALLISRKLDADDRDAHPLTRSEQIARRRQIMQERDIRGWTAGHTAKLLELEGIKVPEVLALEVKKEISWLVPPVEEDGGITDEELDRLSREYMAKNEQIRNQWLPKRRNEVAVMLAAELSQQQGEMIDEAEFVPIDEPESDSEAEEGLSEFVDSMDGDVEEIW